MNDTEKWDRLLKQALAPEAEPDEKLNESIISQLKENNRSKRSYRKRISAAVLVAVFTLVMSVTAFAASQFFSSKQVAEHLGEQILAKAFDSSDAIEINQTIDSGDYSFTLHGIVSGAGLRELKSSAQDIYPDRTYAVVSVARQDGGPMPSTSDPEYGKEPFFVSPLIKGQKPWQVNIATMNGGYSEVVLDGIMYRLIECDGVEMFADRGVYLAVSSGSSFYNSEAFAYNESTGEVSARTDYKGISLLFDLPLDRAKADRAKADAYLKELLREPSEDEPTDPASVDDAAEADLANKIEALKKKIPGGTVIPESIKEVTADDQGKIHYEYDDWTVTILLEELFVEGQTGISDAVSFSGDGRNYKALQFSKDENGVVTGKIIILE
ncbi:hypothetical protein ACFPVX_13765 [Cohnella faecalis]|uniref:DUF4179 domain-containing protein n=1 Tax=Cohnella faecalis TaxID=2315694 RepID=A0A398CQA3_9BACL|nr:hypothetical protein [Cohnella faecalis]RIE02948.1 hypothetical protein D3H35_20290 [Cohnella faecalis]